jgi:hypothetical protein
MALLASMYCFILALFAWIATYAGWPTSHGAAVWLGVIGLLALLLGLTPLVAGPRSAGG